MYTLIQHPPPKAVVGVNHQKRIQLQYGNSIIKDIQYAPYIISQWERCYALHRKHNHSVFIITYYE